MKACTKKIVYSTAYSTLVHKKPNLTHVNQEFKYLCAVYVTSGPSFLYENLLIRSLILVK